MQNNSDINVSVVIVCMNNLKNLFPCLDSIKEQTKTSYEVLVVAYLFKTENLEKLREKYGWVRIIESNEIRGFAENNNLALRVAKGEFCFVLNDDTVLDMPVIDSLVASMNKKEDAGIMCPVTYYPNGLLQCCGRPKLNAWTYFLSLVGLFHEGKVKSKYVNRNGIFQTYNIQGAAFIIRTALFEQLGWFDETYFFCPEDIALSTLVNKKGYKVYVDTNSTLIHNHAATSSSVMSATQPSAIRGQLIFYSANNPVLYILLGSVQWIAEVFKLFYWKIKDIKNSTSSTRVECVTKKHNLHSIFTRQTPKDIFVKYYRQITNI